MKPNRLYAFQGKQLKNSLQQFWDRYRITGLFTILTILLIIPVATKTVDLTSWLLPEKHTKPTNNFMVNPSSQQVKALTNKPVRSIKILHAEENKSLVLMFDRFLENATVQVYDLNGKRVFISEGQDGKALDLDISEFPTGKYLINVEDNKYNYFSTKFTKE